MKRMTGTVFVMTLVRAAGVDTGAAVKAGKVLITAEAAAVPKGLQVECLLP
jgi:hypothetical protein